MKNITFFLNSLIIYISTLSYNPDIPMSLPSIQEASKSDLTANQDLPPTTSLVYPGTDGRLVYVPDSLGNKIPDFSYAGYKGGGVPIPFVANKETVWPVPGDNSASIQAAIDRISALPTGSIRFQGRRIAENGIVSA